MLLKHYQGIKRTWVGNRIRWVSSLLGDETLFLIIFRDIDEKRFFSKFGELLSTGSNFRFPSAHANLYVFVTIRQYLT